MLSTSTPQICCPCLYAIDVASHDLRSSQRTQAQQPVYFAYVILEFLSAYKSRSGECAFGSDTQIALDTLQRPDDLNQLSRF